MKLLCLIRRRWHAYRTVFHGIGIVAHRRCLRCGDETTGVITNRGRWL